LSLFADNLKYLIVVFTQLFFEDKRKILGDGGVVSINRRCELIAALELFFDTSLILFQPLFQLLNVGLLFEVKRLGVYNPPVALTKDIELAETESHVYYYSIGLFTSGASVRQL